MIPPLTARPNVFIDPACERLGGGIRTGGGVPQCQFQFADYMNLIERQEEYSVYGEFNVALGDAANLHLDAWYAAHDVPEENVAPSFPPIQAPA